MRKTFDVNLSKDDEEKIQVSAGGVLLYRINNKKMELLLMLNRGKYEDFGGRSESFDVDIYHTVAREVYEESNQKINYDSILSRINTADYLVSRTSKYIIFFVSATKEESKLKSKDFGDIEIHDNIPRTVEWVPLSTFLDSDVIRNKLNFRLKNKKIFDYLKKIDPYQNIEKKNTKYLF